jgi:hypothetical protein
MKKINIILSIMMLGIFIGSCKKESTTPAATYPINVKMTDAPGPYDAVFIDLQAVEITGSNGPVVMLNVNPGIYNLLNFSNGIDTLIASGLLTDATVEQIRLILGPNNSVVIDSVSYPLSTPSGRAIGFETPGAPGTAGGHTL